MGSVRGGDAYAWGSLFVGEVNERLRGNLRGEGEGEHGVIGVCVFEKEKNSFSFIIYYLS